MKNFRIKLFTVIAVLSILLVGLSSQVFAQESTPVPTDTAIPTDTLVPTITDTLLPTVTNTLLPTATNTLSPTATNTTVPGATATTSSGTAHSPSLGAAGYYSVLAGTTVTNTGPSSMPGDLGVFSGSAVTGGPVVGPPGVIHAGDSNAAGAQIANSAAFDFLDQGCSVTYAGTKDLVGSNLVAGVYCADAFRLSGTLTLSGTGVWIFKSASDLITSAGSSVVGGDPCNVWWREVSSATIGSGSSFVGNILALTSISLLTNAGLNGRALAQTGQVSLQSNVITGASCLTTDSSATTVNSGTATALAATAAARSVSGLPSSGGAPIQSESYPWALTIIVVLSIIALIFGIRTYRHSIQRK